MPDDLIVIAGQSNGVRLTSQGAFQQALLNVQYQPDVMNVALGATGFVPSASAQDWYATEDNDPLTGDLLDAAIAGIQGHLTTFPESALTTLYWIQGEQDSALYGGFETYFEQLSALYNVFRTTFGPEFQFVVVALADAAPINDTPFLPAFPLVQAAQEAFALAHPEIVFVNPDDLAVAANLPASDMFVDNVHYSDEMYAVLAAHLVDLAQNEPVTGPMPDQGTALADIFVRDIGDDLISANKGEDTIQTGHGADSVDAGRHNDQIWLGADDDLGLGGRGNDSIRGDDGNDAIFGDRGADDLQGNQGADTVFGGEGPDHVSGGTGVDWLIGGDGEDTLLGGRGADTLFGGNDADHLRGGRGADELWGRTGDDILIGDEGDDTLIGAEGADTLTGAEGADVFVFDMDRAGGSNLVTDFTLGTDVILLGGVKVRSALTIEDLGDVIRITYDDFQADIVTNETLTIDDLSFV